MTTTLRGAFLGRGQQLIACAERWLARGHALIGVVSDCHEVSAWTKARGVARITPQDDQAAWLGREPYDYLFSIINHSITAPEVLATAQRMAINFHDSPLPRYAGFNATAWAILDGQSTHGVTWHEMTAEVDAGRILLQQQVEIRDDDTAFTLGVRCAETGVTTFVALVEQLERAARDNVAMSGVPQGPNQDFHLRSDRPDLALLDLSRPADELRNLVRALNFGPDDSWMCKPKLLLAGGVVAVSEARVLEPLAQHAQPGTVLSLQGGTLEVATALGTLQLSELSTLTGARVEAAELRARYGVSEGAVLPPPSAALLTAAHELDKAVTKHERFWVKRLSQLHAPALTELKPHTGEVVRAELTRALPATLHNAPGTRRRNALSAALATYLTRVGDRGTFDLAWHRPLPRECFDTYAASTPLHCDVLLTADFVGLTTQLEAEFSQHNLRHSYARDVALRYRVLRTSERAAALSIGVRVEPTLAASNLVENTYLTLLIAESGTRYAWLYDQRAIADDSMAQLATRFDVLLTAALADEHKPLAELAWLPEHEQTLLLETWQATHVPHAAEHCVHQLFESQVARTPDAVAVRFCGASLTYRELNQRANHTAERLRAAGVGPEVLVGICVERSLELIVGLLGILKAGGAYVPLDPVYPRERLAMMVEDANAPVLVTQRHLSDRLPNTSAQVLCMEDLNVVSTLDNPTSGVAPDNIAYVIFTSGSTGRPKGVVVCHRNVSNFFAGMDAAVGTEPGVWLAVTSISFDISVLELFWTLARGFEVVIQQELDRASMAAGAAGKGERTTTPLDFGLFYFAADSGSATPGAAYRLLLEGAKFADTHDFSAVWTPERHFHAFGGLYPNPAVTTAALSTITQRVALRAGSVVLPLHNPLRVAEDWAVIDQLSGGRVGLSFASGWHVNDFAFFPENYERRREVMLESIDTVLKLWRGEKVTVQNGAGQAIEVSVLPRPIQTKPPIWVASAGSVDTFKLAGKLGFNVLTNMLGQDLADLRGKLSAYRQARSEHGHAGPGQVTVMLHTFVCGDTDEARRLARKPFCDYLASSFDLVKVAPWMFPAFRQPSKSAAQDPSFDPNQFTPEDMAALLEHAFDRYFETAGLFGTPEHALPIIEQLKAIGVNEVACLIDFGIDPEIVLASLPHLDRLRQLSNPQAKQLEPTTERYSVGAQLATYKVTHLQCTPSMARMLLSDPEATRGLRGLRRLLLGGEALPAELAEQLLPTVGGPILNMYGPTETTVWSTTSKVTNARDITIGRPIANTVTRILDRHQRLVPVGTPGELCIGGAGVVRGYLGRPGLTAERFIADPYAATQTIYRTGDLARYRADGEIEFLGRLDHQVKVNGYRIELSEIENALTRHPAIRQSVVVARSDQGTAQLVGYVVAAGRDSGSGGDKERVKQWESLWDETYRQAHGEFDPRFNSAGWIDSYTRQPIADVAMREWLDLTERSILALKPRRMLEIGCGTGMVLYRVLPHVEHYTAVDLSPHALETIRRELRQNELSQVTLLQQPAHALEGVTERSCDTAVLNSVVQYFPDADYLRRVLRRASELVSDGGHIFVGDVRSLAHLEAFHTLIELHQAPAHLTAAELAKRAQRRVANDGELVLAPAFFEAFTRDLPRVSGVDIR
ncbi:MAG: hypothetical protein RL701_6281, partial [Pseudomonadota bacterium]